jgi:hypothetical protein
LKTWILVLAAFAGLARIADAEIGEMILAGQEKSTGSGEDYSVIGATPDQESGLRKAIETMNPRVLPSRVVFVPHWKYLDDARILRLHVPSGYMSHMFTHLPTRTVYIDTARYRADDWLGYWMAHELGHLATNSAREEDAERVAREFRKRLKQEVGRDPGR